MRFDLSDEEWAILEPLIPGARRVDDRKVMNGIFFVLRTGIPWRDLPERYGPYGWTQGPGSRLLFGQATEGAFAAEE